MNSFVLAAAVGSVLMILGCDVPDRVSRLEKETQETKTEIEKIRTARSATADYDLQAKCSKDAKTFFTEGWRRDKDTVLLDYSNHYNKAQNKCFISVEYHFHSGTDGSWTNDMSLWDVYENVKYGFFFETHEVVPKPEYHVVDSVGSCEFFDKKCKTIDEFNGFIGPYLNN
jgi:outer membrane murein-binding lipoprotein Lpp